MSLLEDRDIFNIVAFEFLDFKDLVNFDTAVVEENERARFLELLETVPYKPPFHDDLEKWWLHHRKCMQWLSKRKMFCPEGRSWHVNKTSWLALLEDESFNYRPLIGSLKGLFFEGFGGNFDLKGFDLCDSLETLQLCNNNLPQRAPVSPPLPMLRELILQNTRVCDTLLQNFTQAPQLTQLTLRHATYENLSTDVLRHYLRSIHTVRVLHRVPDFIGYFCKEPNQFEVAYLDLLHTTQNTEFDFEPFLKQSPNLRELHIERTCVDVQTLFTAIAKHCPQLEFLHLNHVRMAAYGTSTHRTFDGETSFTKLKISTLLPPLDEHYIHIVRLTNQKIQDLHISFAERLTDNGLQSLSDLCPHLKRFHLEEKEELLVVSSPAAPVAGAGGSNENTDINNSNNSSSSSGGNNNNRIDRIAQIFTAVDALCLETWNGWVFEHLKPQNMHLRKVVYERGPGWK